MNLFLTESRVISTLQVFLDQHPFQADVRDYLVGSVPKTGVRNVTFETYFILPTEDFEELIFVKVNTYHPDIIQGYRVLTVADIIGFSASRYIRGYQVRLRTSDGFYIKMNMGKGNRRHTPLLGQNLERFIEAYLSLERSDFSNPQLNGIWLSLSKIWYNLDMTLLIVFWAFILSLPIYSLLPYPILIPLVFPLVLMILLGIKRLLLVTPRKDTI